MYEIVTPEKLVKLTLMTLKNTNSKLETAVGLSQSFDIGKDIGKCLMGINQNPE